LAISVVPVQSKKRHFGSILFFRPAVVAINESLFEIFFSPKIVQIVCKLFWKSAKQNLTINECYNQRESTFLK
jgi:hypothetical protein